ncbi:hypothetical protein Q7P35_005145 [Cladosporium inversicolor]
MASDNYLLDLDEGQLQRERNNLQGLDQHYAEKLDRAVTAMYSILESILADGSAWFSQIDTNTIYPSVFVYKARAVEKKLALIRRNVVLSHPTFLDEQRDAERQIKRIERERVQAAMEAGMKGSYCSGILHAALLWIMANIVSFCFVERATFVKWALIALGLLLVSRGWTMSEVPLVVAWVRSRYW